MKKRALMLSAAAAALFSGRVLADTDITTKVTSPVNTSTDGNITIESDGSIIITTSPPSAPAITINSDAVVNNEGQIAYDSVTSATGVELETGFTGEFESTGKISLTGSGTSKTGILISGPAGNLDSGTFTGVIPAGATSPVAIDLESGSTMDVQGDNSYGIDQLAGTNIVGDIDLDGTLNITPTSATSTKTAMGNIIAVNLQGTMTGNLNIGTGAVVSASGQGAEGIQLLGALTGSIVNDGTLQTFGSARAGNSNVNTVLPDAGTALGIGASVSGGIYNAGPSTASDTTTARSIISTVGDAPTILINPTIGNTAPTSNLVIGIYSDPTDPGYSFLNRGGISGSSDNAGVDVTTFSIVGASSTAQTILQGGLFNGGSIAAAATTNTKVGSVSADALYIGGWADVPVLTNSNKSTSGIISATVTGPELGTATAISIQQNATLSTINNSGTITASVSTSNPQFVTSLTAYAIYDASGSLDTIINSGTISAVTTTLLNNGQSAVAADLSVNSTGVNFDNTGNVTGAILFGTGNDTLTDTGTAQIPANVTGNVSFGGSSNGGDDTLYIGEFGTLTGAVTEQLGSRVNVTIAQGGTLNLENTPTNLGLSNVVGLYAGSFDVATGANLGLVVSQPFNVTVNPQTGALIQAQNASIGDDTDFKISFGSYIGNYIPGRGNVGNDPTASFDLISTPKGALAISSSELATINTDFSTTIPFLFTGDLCTWNINGASSCGGHNPGNSELVLDLTPKSAQTLGLTGYALKMFPYANQALAYDDALGAAMLNDISNNQQAQAAYAAYAPDVSGATRALAISLTDGATNVVAARQRTLREYVDQDGDLTLWTQEFAERLNQDNTTAGTGYGDTGFGFVLGADEGDPADGRYGGAFTFFSGGMDAKAPVI